MGREKRVSVLNPDREGAGGTGWADRLYTPVTLAPQSSACLTACLASPGINGVQGSRRTQKILYISLKKFAFLFKAVQFYIGLCLVW